MSKIFQRACKLKKTFELFFCGIFGRMLSSLGCDWYILYLFGILLHREGNVKVFMLGDAKSIEDETGFSHCSSDFELVAEVTVEFSKRLVYFNNEKVVHYFCDH